MKRQFDLSNCEVAMRVLARVQGEAKSNPKFRMVDVANTASVDLGLSRASAYRYVRTAIDVLGLHYKPVPSRHHWECV